MKKKLVFGLVMILALACVLVSCNSEVSAENGAGSAKTGSIVLGKETSKGIGYSVDYSYEVEQLYWFYTAVKKDNGYRTGEKTSQVAVKTGEAGLTGKVLSGFSYGLWDLTFYGYETSDGPNAENEVKRAVIYQGSKVNFLVSGDNNYADIDLDVMDAGTVIVFDGAEGIYFTFDHNVSASVFELSITDNKGTVNVNNIENTDKAYTITNSGSEYKVKFSNIEYVLDAGKSITGDHTMTFTLKQTLVASTENVEDIQITAATYTLPFNVAKGTKTTIGGDMTKNDQQGDILINSAALNVQVAVASKVVPIDNTSVTTDGDVKTATVSTTTKVSNGDMAVTYPAGAKIITSDDATFSEDGKTSDAETGFEYTSDSLSAAASSVVINENQTVAQYKLTLNVSQENTVLLTVEKFIGTGLSIDAIYHNGEQMATSAAEPSNDSHEWYSYDEDTGYLTLHVKHASPFDIVMKSGTGAGVKYVERKVPTCTEDGNIAYSYYMVGSEKVITGGLLENETEANGGIIIPATGHKFYDKTNEESNTPEHCANCNATREGYVARIGETDYYRLRDAIAAVTSSEETTITLLADDTIYGNVGWTIPVGKNIVLDLNGHTLKNAVNADASSQVITNNGTLTIKDKSDSSSNGSGTGLIVDAMEGALPGEWWSNPQRNYATNVINNCGNLIIESGVLYQTANGSICYAIDNNSTSRDAVITIKGGLVDADNHTTVRMFCNSTSNNNQLNMTGGMINNKTCEGLWIQLPGSNSANMKKATLNITGGTIAGGEWSFYDYSFGDGWNNVNYSVSGGVFEGIVETSKNDGTYKFITGGTFNQDPTNYVAPGYYADDTVEEGKWVVKPYTAADSDVSVTKDNKTVYMPLDKFRDAVNAGTSFEGYTVKLLHNVDLSSVNSWTPIGTKTHPFVGTFDGDGYTISNLTINGFVEGTGTGFFGYVKGKVNESYTDLASVWDGTELNEANIAESKYTAVIKRINFENVSIANSDTADNKPMRHTGGVVGYAENAYLLDLNVISGTVSGRNGIGGIVGSFNASVAKGCSNIANITASEYNAGGIIGRCNADIEGNKPRSAIIGCSNSGSVTVTGTIEGQTSGGNVAGIVALAQANFGECGILVNCSNSGAIRANNSSLSADIGGVAGTVHGFELIKGCSNTGNLYSAGNARCVAGIAALADYSIIECQNSVDINVSADYLAGIFNEHTRHRIATSSECNNSGSLTNAKEGGLINNIYNETNITP